MIATLSKALTSPAAGPAATAVAVMFAGALTATAVGAHRREAGFRAQVDALAARAEQQGTYWKTQLTACRAEAAQSAPAAPPLRVMRIADADADAARLASEGPAGFDACARMVAADQAVLATLRHK